LQDWAVLLSYATLTLQKCTFQIQNNVKTKVCFAALTTGLGVMFLFDLGTVQLLEHLTVAVGTDCVT
jgi:hypothetical protein